MQIIHGDCLETLKEFPDDHFDLCITSPPYEAARLYGELEFKFKGQEYIDWAIARYAECYRVTKGLVAWVIEGQTRNFQWSATPAILMADLHRRGIRLRKPPVFHRVGIPGSGGREWLRNDYEFIICASKGKLPWADNTACGSPPKYPVGGDMSYRLQDGSRRNDRTYKMRDGDEFRRKRYSEPPLCNPGNVIHCAVGGGKMGSPLAHENEAPFPEKLVEFFVKSFCPPGGRIIDPFGGSGTTGAVAARLGREATLIELRASQVEIAKRRIMGMP